jgi:hypothetical protein
MGDGEKFVAAVLIFFAAGISIQLTHIQAMMRALLPKKLQDTVGKPDPFFSTWMKAIKSLLGLEK